MYEHVRISCTYMHRKKRCVGCRRRRMHKPESLIFKRSKARGMDTKNVQTMQFLCRAKSLAYIFDNKVLAVGSSFRLKKWTSLLSVLIAVISDDWMQVAGLDLCMYSVCIKLSTFCRVGIHYYRMQPTGCKFLVLNESIQLTMYSCAHFPEDHGVQTVGFALTSLCFRRNTIFVTYNVGV